LVFKKILSIFNFIVNTKFTINPTLHYPRTHYSIIPAFQYSFGRDCCLKFSKRARQKRMRSLPRRYFLRWLLGLPLLSSLPFRLRETWADPPALPRKGGSSIGEFFKGEELFYDGGFWLFKRVATGKISFKKLEEEGRYIATLQGETLGVLGWAVRYRVDTYRTVMEEVDGGRRLRSI